MSAFDDELRRGHEAREQGRIGEATALYRNVAQGGDPETAPLAELYLGVVAEGRGDRQAARVHYSVAIGSEHPEAALLALFNLAKIHEFEGEPDWAVHRFKEVLEVEEQHPWATPWAAYNTAVLLWKQGAWVPGKAYMEQAVRLGEQHGNAEVVAKAKQGLSALPG